MTAELTPAEAEAGWISLEAAASYSHYRPLADAAQRFVDEAQSERRVTLGMPSFDYEMRGISPGHLAFVVGYSHSGKTLLALQILRHNADRRVALFTPDEPATLVLTKLASLTTGISARELEARVADNDRDGLRLLHETVEQYPNLAIFDKPLTPRSMRAGYDEVTDHWSAGADLVMLDYLDLLQIGDSLSAKADSVKSFGTDRDVPMLVLHQTSRSAGTAGKRMRIDSGNFGGETWATFQLGVWRKKFAIEHELHELEERRDKPAWVWDRMEELQRQSRIHDYTVTVNLSKNKRPGGKRLDEGVDFEIDLHTGAMHPLNGDLPHQYRQTLGRLRAVNDPYDYRELEDR
jgi:hypothetical protein